MTKERTAILIDWDGLRADIDWTRKEKEGYYFDYNLSHAVAAAIRSFFLEEEGAYRVYFYTARRLTADEILESARYFFPGDEKGYETFRQNFNVERAEEARERNDQFLRQIRRAENFTLREGKLILTDAEENGKYRYQQKQVDMLIALDMANLAIGRMVDRIVFYTNDSDFKPAIEFAKERGVQVILAGITEKRYLTNDLYDVVDGVRKISMKEAWERFSRKG